MSRMTDNEVEAVAELYERKAKEENQKLWDYFAGHALANTPNTLPPSEKAQQAAQIATEMMKQRKRNESNS